MPFRHPSNDPKTVRATVRVRPAALSVQELAFGRCLTLQPTMRSFTLQNPANYALPYELVTPKLGVLSMICTHMRHESKWNVHVLGAGIFLITLLTLNSPYCVRCPATRPSPSSLQPRYVR